MREIKKPNECKSQPFLPHSRRSEVLVAVLRAIKEGFHITGDGTTKKSFWREHNIRKKVNMMRKR